MTATNKLCKVLSVPSEDQAALVVSALAEAGIKCSTTGGFTSGFATYVPGEVSVMIPENDLSKAHDILSSAGFARELSNAQIEADEANVGYGHWYNIFLATKNYFVRSMNSFILGLQKVFLLALPSRPQFRLRSLFLLQIIVSLILFVFVGPRETVIAGVGCMIAISVLAGTTISTVLVAANPSDARETWRACGQMLFPLIIISFFIYLSVVLISWFITFFLNVAPHILS